MLCIVQTSGCWSFPHYSSFNVIYTGFQKATLSPSITGSRGGSTCPDNAAQPFYFGERTKCTIWLIWQCGSHIFAACLFCATQWNLKKNKTQPSGQHFLPRPLLHQFGCSAVPVWRYDSDYQDVARQNLFFLLKRKRQKINSDCVVKRKHHFSTTLSSTVWINYTSDGKRIGAPSTCPTNFKAIAVNL